MSALVRSRSILLLSMVLGATMVALASPGAALASVPTPWPLPQEVALTAVRAIDPRFADLPTHEQAYQQSVSELDMAPILAGSWINVLSTFETQGPPWTDLGRGLLVEVMLTDGCLDRMADVQIPGDGDPCRWRHSWIYRLLPSGEAVLVTEGGDPEG